jgi:hypothetical protein
MTGAKSVVYIYVGYGSQVFTKFLVIFAFFFAKAGIFQKYDVAILSGSYRGTGVIAHHCVVSREVNGLAQQVGQPNGHGRERRAWVWPLGFAKVRAKYNLSSIGYELLDSWQSGFYAIIVRYRAILQRHVKVHTHQNAFALYAKII